MVSWFNAYAALSAHRLTPHRLPHTGTRTPEHGTSHICAQCIMAVCKHIAQGKLANPIVIQLRIIIHNSF